ncbi:Probable D-alanyl-D-alanine carboxypeptidase [gamma proteobacterium HdN1]|nr:Probable D-alanyl-D-alanine carboxypeptidase [gamma proteobacterium HdN1]
MASIPFRVAVLRNFFRNHIASTSRRSRPLAVALVLTLTLSVGVGATNQADAATTAPNKARVSQQQAKRPAAVKKTQVKRAQVKRVAKSRHVAKKPVRRVTRARVAAAGAAAATAAAVHQTITYETRSSSMLGRPGLQSRAALVMDADTGEILYGKNSNETVPIASITKLMTAIVVLDAGQSMHEILTITNDDVDTLRHSSSRLRVGTRLPRGEMMHLALMSSENRAASALIRNYPGGLQAGLRAMNAKAAELGMTSSHFYDGTGLNGGNRASLFDLAKMVKAANTYPEIHDYSTSSSAMVSVAGYRNQLRYVNTNPLVNNSGWDIGVTKTGYIREAGKCLVMQARIGATNTVLVLMDSWGAQTRVGDANRVKHWMETSGRLVTSSERRVGDHRL